MKVNYNIVSNTLFTLKVLNLANSCKQNNRTNVIVLSDVTLLLVSTWYNL